MNRLLQTNYLPKWITTLSLLALLNVTTVGCSRVSSPVVVSSDPGGAVWFQDVSQDLGLDFVHDPGPIDGHHFMPQIVGSGAALFDFDNDGRLDILLLQNAGPNSKSTNRLYHQEKDGRYRDVSLGSGLDFAGYNMGVAIGDIDNDGWPDVLITQFGGIKLFRNNGNGTFQDISQEAGLQSLLWGTSACFADFDRDGWLDLVVVNYVDYDRSRSCENGRGQSDYCAPQTFPGTVTQLYRNQTGEKGPAAGKIRFEDRTLQSGIGRLPGPGLGVACADFNGDGWPDIFVANDAEPNRLWINQRDGTFKDEAILRNIAYNGQGNTQGNMGVALGDIFGLGFCDVFVTHLTWEHHTLWQQNPRGQFKDRTTAAGLTRSAWRGTGFGTVLADFDHDGRLDLALVNGRVARAEQPAEGSLSAHWAGYAERNQLFAGTEDHRFRDVSKDDKDFCGTPAVSRGLAMGDITGQGAMDLLVTTAGGPARILRNVAANRKGTENHWLLVRAIDPVLKRDAYGAQITLQSGENRWVGWVNPGQSYLSSNDARVHFGLGKMTRVDVQILWPDGGSELFTDVTADQRLLLTKGKGTALKPNN